MIPVFSVEEQRPGLITRARFSPAIEDHRAMCIESNGAITLIDLKGVKYRTGHTYEYTHNAITGFSNYLLDFNFTADGRIVFIGDSFGNVTMDSINHIGNHISKKRGHLLRIDNAHEGGVFSVLPSPNYEFLVYTGGGDGMIRIWDIRFMVPGNPLLAYRQRSAPSKSKATDGGLTKKPLHELWAHKNAVSSICFPERKCLLSSGMDENLRLWDINHNAVIATIRSYGTALGIWDIAINKALGRVVVLGQSTDIWAFYINDFVGNKSPELYEMVTLEIEDGEPNDTDNFSRWRRMCSYGTNVIVPTLNNQLGAKAVVLDVATGGEVYRLMTDVVDRVHAIDAHPKVSSGLIVTGGTKNNRTVCTIWMEGEGMCTLSL